MAVRADQAGDDRLSRDVVLDAVGGDLHLPSAAHVTDLARKDDQDAVGDRRTVDR
jgi:hypothetical protein